MTKRRSPEVQAILRERGNPYWSLQLDAQSDDEQAQGVDARRAYFRALENPHAHDYVFGQHSDEPAATVAKPIQPDKASTRGISKLDFQKGCRLVFENYISPFEPGGIRKAHREFIARNQDRGPAGRARLLAQLQKYDLSQSGVRPMFNREREDLTDRKLRQIESDADSSEEQ